ncbi:MAG: hypothetical protein PHV53_04925 [Fermentimonas sp.]|nr:hypothetical protein [Fermentimonas sp.]
MKQFYILMIMLFFASQAISQDYDYLSLLNSFPPVPDNSLTGSKEEKESFINKLEVINSLLWDLEEAQKEAKRKSESEPFPFNLNNKDRFEKAKEEWDSLFQKVLNVIMDHSQIELDLLDQWRSYAALQMAGEGKDKLSLHKQLDKNNIENLQALIQECKEMTPIVEKLDNYTVDGYKLSNNDAGLYILREVYNSFETVYRYNLGPKEQDPLNSLLEMRQMFNTK